RVSAGSGLAGEATGAPEVAALARQRLPRSGDRRGSRVGHRGAGGTIRAGEEAAQDRGRVLPLHRGQPRVDLQLRGSVSPWREAISTAFAESTVNQVFSKRMVKKQQMRWTGREAHLLLQVRTQVFNGDLRTTFQRWYPGMNADAAQTEEAAA